MQFKLQCCYLSLNVYLASIRLNLMYDCLFKHFNNHNKLVVWLFSIPALNCSTLPVGAAMHLQACPQAPRRKLMNWHLSFHVFTDQWHHIIKNNHSCLQRGLSVILQGGCMQSQHLLSDVLQSMVPCLGAVCWLLSAVRPRRLLLHL